MVEENTGVWTEIIEPKTKWYDIKFKELWNYRDLIMIFVNRDIKAVYKQTILGPVWFFLSPLFTAITFTFVFNNIAKISTDGVPAPLFYLAGTTLWNYFQNCFTATSNTFVSNAGIFGKVYFPRLASPISIVFSNLLKFSIQMLMFLCFWGYFWYTGQISPSSMIIILPLLVVIMGGMALGVGIIFSSLTTKYRDFNFLLAFGVSLLMYASPIIYPSSAIPDIYKPFLSLNPIAPIIEAFRFVFTGAGSLSWKGLAYSGLFTTVALAIGVVLFNKIEKTFMDTV